MTTQEIITEAKKLKELGSPLTIEQLEALVVKMDSKKAKKAKRSAKRWDKRDSDAIKAANSPNPYEGMTIAEINKMNATNNLPSSMRK